MSSFAEASSTEPTPVEEALIDAPFDVSFVHRVRFTQDALDPGNGVLRDVMGDALRDGGEPRRTVVFIDDGVAAAWPLLAEQVTAYASAHADVISLAAPPIVTTGGEAAKCDTRVVDEVYEAVHRHAICRRSFVVAIGGGAFLDAIGFGAATAHRGVRLVRLPTTVLAQDDAAMGVKNGVNRFGKKNFVGAFTPPWAVVNDSSFLTTLSDRQFRAGLSECVKVALVRDSDFMARLEATATRLAARDMSAAAPAIHRAAELHLRHITGGGDPFELTEARPLDFGHWSAHKLEQMSGFTLPHGEAVSIGVALDALYSTRTGRLPERTLTRVIACLRSMQLPTAIPAGTDVAALMAGLEEFREHLGGRLTITLLRDVGQPEDVHEIDAKVMAACIRELR